MKKVHEIITFAESFSPTWSVGKTGEERDEKMLINEGSYSLCEKYFYIFLSALIEIKQFYLNFTDENVGIRRNPKIV